MSLPPENIGASALWLHLSALPRASKRIPVPKIDPRTGEPVGEVCMRVLTQEEQLESSAAAEQAAREILKSPAKKDEASLGYDNIFGNEACVQILWRACRSAEDQEQPAFPSPKLMKKVFTTDEMGILFDHYLTVQLELGPIVADLSELELEAWVERIREGGSAFPFDLLSSDMRKALVLFMACRMPKSPTGTSSAGSPPEEPPETPPSTPHPTTDA